MNKENLAYELGVLMFNFAVDEIGTLIALEDYDMMGNFCGIIDSLTGVITLDDLQDGFIAEAQNYEIDKEKALQMFKKAKQNVESY